MSAIPITVAGLRNILKSGGGGIVSYARSTDLELLGRCGQDEEVRLWGEANGYEIVGYFHDSQTPNWVSVEERVGLSHALKVLQLPHIAGLAVHQLDRITRDIGLMLDTMEQIWDTDSDLYSTDMGRIPRGRRGREVVVQAAVCGKRELDAARRRMQAGKRVKAEDGGYTGGNRFHGRPYGRIRQGSNYAPVPEEQAVIARMVAACPNGRGYQAMAEQLNREGVPTVSGARWSATVVRGLVLEQRKTLVRLSARPTPLMGANSKHTPDYGVAGAAAL